MNPEHKKILDSAVEAARLAGDVLLGYFRSDHLKVLTKLNESDIVTEADRASESVILRYLGEHFPDHAVLSEESGVSGGEADYQWVIDPLDGTTNFRSGLPNFSVSIGVKYKGETVAGVVYAPYLRELFCAVRGGGATLNGKPIHCSSIASVDRSVLATGFPVDKNVNPDNNLDNVARILPHIRGLRRLGSAAIDICYTAAGFLEGYWELNLHEWDVCAGLLVAEEAGCEYSFFRAEAERNLCLAVAAPQIYKFLIKELQ